MNNPDPFDQTLLTVPIDWQLELILTDQSTRSLTRNNNIDHGKKAGDAKTNEKGRKEADGFQKSVSGNVSRSSDTDGSRKSVSGNV